MNRIFLLAFILVCLAFGATAGTLEENLTFEHGGIERSYHLYLPDDFHADAPLVFVLHGLGGSAYDLTDSGFEPLADANGFGICFPQGSRANNGETHWNAQLTISEVDDAGFLAELAAALQNERGFDPARTFIAGHSNGGFMSYAVALLRPGVFAAIAPVGGTMSGQSWEDRQSAKPTPVFHIHGTDDDVVPINGSLNVPGGWSGAPHVDEIVSFWAQLSGANTIVRETIAGVTQAAYYQQGVNGNQIWYYKVDGLGHQWPGPELRERIGFNGPEAIWQFFSTLANATSRKERGLEDVEFFVYPNPAANAAYFSAALKAASPYALYSVSGEKVLAGTLPAGADRLSLDGTPAGMYYLRLGNTAQAVVVN